MRLMWRESDVPAASLISVDLAEFYPWPEGSWVRAMMVTTLDGAAAGPDGRSRSISSNADLQVLIEARRLCDAVLVGAGTIRAERYKPFRVKQENVQSRVDAGLAPSVVPVIVSQTLDLPWDDQIFSESDIRPIVVTHESVSPSALSRAGEAADLMQCGSTTVDLAMAIESLQQRGIQRIVCEGGPTLLQAMFTADLIDEADISLAPLFVGGQSKSGTPWQEVKRMRLIQVLEDDGFLFNRYIRAQLSS